MIEPIVDSVPSGAVLIDVRYYPGDRDGRAAYAAGHIPDARFVDLESVLAAPPGGTRGRHPLPEPEQFAAGLAAAGVRDDDVVVAYDDANAIAASRLVWMLRVIGQDAAVLDGGLAAADGPLESGWPDIEPVQRAVQAWPVGATVDADEIVAFIAAGGVVADSRAAARYHGEPHPLDTASGHIPGAVSLPFDGAIAHGRFGDREALRARYADAGLDGDSVFYCGSGVSACVNVLAAEHAGLPRPRLYVGSWSGWTSDPERPIEV